MTSTPKPSSRDEQELRSPAEKGPVDLGQPGPSGLGQAVQPQQPGEQKPESGPTKSDSEATVVGPKSDLELDLDNDASTLVQVARSHKRLFIQ